MQLFNSILSDLFPGMEVPKPDYTDLCDAITAHCAKRNLIPTEAFLFKCIQIFEVSVLRHGLMTVGPSGGAKTTRPTCSTRMGDLDGPTRSTRVPVDLNPKAITMGQLYGEFTRTHDGRTASPACSTARPSRSSEFGDRNWSSSTAPSTP